MRRWIAMALLVGGGLLPSVALAARELGDFKEPQEMTPEELEASKALSKSPVHAYSKGVTDQVTPVPWKTIALFSVILLLATPYALRYYRSTAGESAGGKTRRAPSARAQARAVFEETKVRNPNPQVEGDTRVPIRRNTRP